VAKRLSGVDLDVFGVVIGVSQGMSVFDGMIIVEGEAAVFGSEFGHPVVTNGTFLRSCARATPSSQITLGRTC